MRTPDEELMHSKLDDAIQHYLDCLYPNSVSAKYADEHYIEGFIAGWNAVKENT